MTPLDLTGRTLGGYRILRKLGAGGMAVVYKAHEGSLNRMVALKVIHEHLARQPEFVERFAREARAAAQLSHPNIVQIYAIGEEHGVPFFSMEYVKGRSLQAVIETEGFFTPARAVPIVEQVCHALAAAHEAGIVHRDIKPSNIMLDDAGRVKVADFGIAHVATESRLTQSGMLLGTPGYTSPEQCLGEPLDSRSDIYALGVTAYEMLTGHTPFYGDTPAAMLLQIVEGRCAPLAAANPVVPPELQDIVARMMHRNPAERFQSAEDVIDALRAPRTAGPLPTVQRRSAPVAERGGVAAAAATPATEPTVLRTAGASPPASPAPVAPSRGGLALRLAVVVLASAVLVGAGWWVMRLSGWERGVGDVAAAASTAPAPAAGDATGVVEAPVDDAAPLAVPAPEPAPAVAQVPAAETEPAAVATLVAAAETTPAAAATPVPAAEADAIVAAPPAGERGDSTPTPAVAATAAAADLPSEPVVDSSGPATLAAAPAPAPPDRAVVTTTVGEYENASMLRALVEGELSRSGFAIVDIVPRQRRVEEVARFEIVATVRVVGSRNLVFFGRTERQDTVAITLHATDLSNGGRAAGPHAATAEYTAINLENNLRQTVAALARDLIRDLQARLPPIG